MRILIMARMIIVTKLMNMMRIKDAIDADNDDDTDDIDQ